MKGLDMKALALAVTAALLPGVALADACFRDLKSQGMFGSTEQVSAIQALAKGKCEIVGLTWRIERPAARKTLIVADLASGEMIRLKVDPVSRPWESWKGFTREQLLADSPSDGFDLPGFVASKGERPSVPPRIERFVRDRGMAEFLP